jgi:hypothetical protein
MAKVFAAVALMILGFAGTALACEGGDSAMSTPTVTTAQSGSSGTTTTPAPATPSNGG